MNRCKRPVIHQFLPASKRLAKSSVRSSEQNKGSAILQALFEDEDMPFPEPIVGLSKSDSDSGSDTFYHAVNLDAFDDTPGSPSCTNDSTPPSDEKEFADAAPAASTVDAAVAFSNLPPLSPRFGNMGPFIVLQTHYRVNIMQKKPDGRLAIPWGVQFYLASLVSHGLFTMDELNATTGINALRSDSNVESICALFNPDNQHLLWDSRVETPIMARRVTDRERQVCAELDREAGIRADSPLNGVLGPPGEEMKSFGGKVTFEGRIFCKPNEDSARRGKAPKHCEFAIQVLPPSLGGSCRFSRRFGSESILRLKMDAKMSKDARRFAVHAKTHAIQQEISDFFSRKINIMGRLYRPFICKDDTIFYLRIGTTARDCPDRPAFSCIWDFIDHHAPFAENGHSQLGKFIQRVLLGLSTSIPASAVEEIRYEPDVFGDPDPITGKRLEMTDGASAISLAVARDIAQHLGFDSVPAAFQGRFAGSKGVWYVDPCAERPLPGEAPRRWIKVRDSQKKINYPENKPLDLSQLVVDLLGPTRTYSPSTLSRQIILVLQSNGVPITAFVDMQRAELCKIANEISDWEGPDAAVCMRLASVVERLCKVESLKAKRSTESAEHRAQGMVSHISAGGDRELGDDDREVFFSRDGRHMWNGKPVCKHECAYEMLLVGFHPRSCSYLSELLVDLADMAMKKVIKRFAIGVARSAEAMVIPDPTGTLEEGEIQFRFSGDSVLDPDTRLRLSHVPAGDVLVTRHPCLLPTDIRKVRAVVRSELSMYQDVVIFSTKGQRPLASLLSGGDYDGDLIRVFWETQLVEPFQNAEISYADCPFEINDIFTKSELRVADFVAEHVDKDEDERDRKLVKELVAGAFQPAVRGLYGMMHLYAAWQFGTRSSEAVELAHKFCQCMDSQKTGLTLRESVRIQDSKLYLGELPDWAKDTADDSDSRDWFALDDYGKTDTAIKNKNRPKSVLCALWDEGKRQMGKLKQQLQERTQKLRGTEDTAISGLWKEAKRLGRISREEEEAIVNHVKVMEESYIRTNGRTRQVMEEKNRKGPAKSSKRETRAMPLRRVQSEVTSALLGQASVKDRARRSGDAGTTVDDFNSSELSDRLNETIEVPAILGSSSEVATRFCQWPKAFVKSHIMKMDKAEVNRLSMLRASYAYSITYSRRPRFGFEMA